MTHSADETRERWKREQARIRSELLFADSPSATFNVSSTSTTTDLARALGLQDEYDHPTVHLERPEEIVVDGLRYIGGVDISFVPSVAFPSSPTMEPANGPAQEGVATVAILVFPSLQLVHSLSRRIILREPYISSYLAFREAPPLLDLISDLKADLARDGKLDEFPQVLFVDGNGRLHERECGLACVLGLALGLPTVGISKKPYIFPSSAVVPSFPAHWRSNPHALVATLKMHLRSRGSWLGLFPPPSPRTATATDSSLTSRAPAQGESPFLGAAVIPSASSRTAVFVSAGHLLSLETCVRLTVLCSKTKIPEPVRRADLEGREQVRVWVRERERVGAVSVGP